MELVNLLNKGLDFTFKEKTYVVLPWVLAVQAEFEKYVISNAWANLNKSRPYVDEDQYRNLQDGLRRDIDTGYYDWGGNATSKIADTPKHLKHLIYLLLAYGNRGKDKEKITKEIIEEIFKDSEKRKELLEKIYEVNRDPKEVLEEQTTPPNME